MITLSKQQTYQLLYDKNKSEAIQMLMKNRYKASTKFKWYCISCLKPIYIKHDNCSRRSIYCGECFSKNQLNTTIAEQHYLRKLKEEQLNQLRYL